MSEDPIGLGGGQANVNVYVGNNPATAVDSSGLFKSFVHKQITNEAFSRSGIIGRNSISDGKVTYTFSVQDAIKNIDVNVDFGPTLFDDSYHASAPSFLVTLSRKMDEIKKPRPLTVHEGIEVLRAMGESLHILQDFFTHTDFINGNELIPLYESYRDLSTPYYGKWFTDLGEQQLINNGQSHASHHGLILNISNLGAVNGLVHNLNYFAGGYVPFGVGSQHNRYAADTEGFGRDAPWDPTKTVSGGIFGIGLAGKPGIPDPFEDAFNQATAQSQDFLVWAYKNMPECIRKMLFVNQ